MISSDTCYENGVTQLCDERQHNPTHTEEPMQYGLKQYITTSQFNNQNPKKNHTYLYIKSVWDFNNSSKFICLFIIICFKV